MSKTYVYISRWNEFVGQPGIALLEFNPENGDLKFLENLEEKLTCNCTCVDRERNILDLLTKGKPGSANFVHSPGLKGI